MRHAIIILAFVAVSIIQARAQSDNLTAAKAAVEACVTEVRNQAKRPENFQFGVPPMWRNFDAYIAPDGRIFNNVRFVGEQDGLYRFDKCLAQRGFSNEGAFVAPSRGQVTMKHPDGATYTGEFASGEPNGQGVFVAANGTRLEGTFVASGVAGARGKGTIKYPDGATYTGEFASGEPNGQGVWVAANG